MHCLPTCVNAFRMELRMRRFVGVLLLRIYNSHENYEWNSHSRIPKANGATTLKWCQTTKPTVHVAVVQALHCIVVLTFLYTQTWRTDMKITLNGYFWHALNNIIKCRRYLTWPLSDLYEKSADIFCFVVVVFLRCRIYEKVYEHMILI